MAKKELEKRLFSALLEHFIDFENEEEYKPFLQNVAGFTDDEFCEVCKEYGICDGVCDKCTINK